MISVRLLAALLITGFSAAGCKEKPTTTPTAATAAEEPAPATAGGGDVADLQDYLRKDQPAGAAALPPGHPPMPAPGAAASTSGELPAGHPPVPGSGTAQSAGTLKYDPPLDWKPEPPSSSMRLAQFAMPRAADDGQDGQMIVFYFGPGQGGPTDMNIDRWKNMFTNESGGPVADNDALIEEREIAGLKVTTLDVAGLYNDPMMMQSGGAKIEGTARLLAAIVETPNGSYFFKAVGPKETIAAHEASFRKLVESIRLE